MAFLNNCDSDDKAGVIRLYRVEDESRWVLNIQRILFLQNGRLLICPSVHLISVSLLSKSRHPRFSLVMIWRDFDVPLHSFPWSFSNSFFIHLFRWQKFDGGLPTRQISECPISRRCTKYGFLGALLSFRSLSHTTISIIKFYCLKSTKVDAGCHNVSKCSEKNDCDAFYVIQEYSCSRVECHLDSKRFSRVNDWDKVWKIRLFRIHQDQDQTIIC